MFVGVAAIALVVPTPATAEVTDVRLSYQVPSDEVGNVAIDGSTHANDGVLRGGVSRGVGVYKFHRVSRDHRYDRITAPDDPSLSPGLAPFTFSVRLKVSPDAEWSHSEMAVLRHGDSDTPGGDYKMELRKSRYTGVVSAECVMHDDDGAGAGYIRGRGTLASIADGHWHTIACSRVDAHNVSLSVDDDTTQRPVRGDLGNIVGQAHLMIGCQLGADLIHKREQFVGKLDNITLTVQ
jgi:Laminin G domain